jgi:hypothetical protein
LPGPRFEDTGEAPRLRDLTPGQGRVKERVENSRKRKFRALMNMVLESQKRGQPQPAGTPPAVSQSGNRRCRCGTGARSVAALRWVERFSRSGGDVDSTPSSFSEVPNSIRRALSGAEDAFPRREGGPRRLRSCGFDKDGRCGGTPPRLSAQTPGVPPRA